MPVESFELTHKDNNVPHTLNERRRQALQEIDDAAFSWFHVKVAAVAGAGFLTDAYDTFAISIAAAMIGVVYGVPQVLTSPDDYTYGHVLSASQDLRLKIAAPIGTLVGQLFFGWFADIVGRKRMYGVELMIMIVASFAQALAGQSKADGVIDIISVLMLWRFVMGLGIGGDYPLSATITSEFSATRIRGRLMTAVFAAQGWGNLLAALVGLCVTAGYKTLLQTTSGINQTTPNTPEQIKACEHMWRLVVGLGCIPACIALCFRLTISETPRFTMDIDRNVQQAFQDVEAFLQNGTYYADPDAAITRIAAPRASRRDFRTYFGKWSNFKVLFGTAWSWFALDIAYYGLGLNSEILSPFIGMKNILHPARTGAASTLFESLRDLCVSNIILAFGGLIPGYWMTFLFIDRWGRKRIQLLGFSMLTIIFVIMSAAFGSLDATQDNVRTGGFLALYCFANFFANFGPNTTTFIIPGEAFPTRYRSTSHGISAASGKFGAIIAQVIIFSLGKPNTGSDFHHDPNSSWVRVLLGIFAAFMFSGVISTWLFIPETNGRTLEDISNEDQRNFGGRPSADASSNRWNPNPRAPEHPPFSSNPWSRSYL